jgi:hypothetical protein
LLSISHLVTILPLQFVTGCYALAMVADLGMVYFK